MPPNHPPNTPTLTPQLNLRGHQTILPCLTHFDDVSSPDRGRSDPCSRHQHGRCGRFSCVSARPARRGSLARAAPAHAVDSAQINLPHHHIAVYIYTRIWAPRLISARRLAAHWLSGTICCSSRAKFSRLQVRAPQSSNVFFAMFFAPPAQNGADT